MGGIFQGKVCVIMDVSLCSLRIFQLEFVTRVTRL